MSVGPIPVGVQGPDSAPSRLPKHKRADPENGGETASIRRPDFHRDSNTTRLGTKPGLQLREEAVEQCDGDLRARSWSRVTREWRKWMRDALDTSAVFTGTDVETGDQLERTAPLENRFMKVRQRRTYAKLHDVARGAREEFGGALHVALLSFTASNTSGAGDWWRCPANHLDDLLGSWSAVRRQLHRLDRQIEYARILEPHASGYAHVHVAVFARGPLTHDDLQPVLDAHVRNCLPASPEAHVAEEGAAEIRRPGRDLESVAAYISGYLMKWGEKALEAPEHVQRFNALLWASQRRRWSLSEGAQEWAAWEPPETVDTSVIWEMTHIDVGQDRYPVERGGGEVPTEVLPESGAGLDPPPVRN